MFKFIHISIATVLLVCSTLFAEPVQITLNSGKTWHGEIGQTVTVEISDRGKTKIFEGELSRATDAYIVVDGELIFMTDIVSIKPDGDAPTTTPDAEDGEEAIKDSGTTIEPVKVIKEEGELPRGVFYLPMHEGVGDSFRPTEIKRLAQHIDENYGPGQIIVLEIDSGGGSVKTWSEIRDLVFEIRERHRMVAWITQAISGGAATGFLCDEVYYKSIGTLGSITMWSGNIENAAPVWQAELWITELAGVLAKTSQSPLIAGCMVRSVHTFSYDKDPETGNITYHDDLSGEHILSRSDTNLTFGAHEAFEAGFCDGIADSREELALLLDLDEWIEIDTFGEDMAKEWWATLKEWDDVGRDLYETFAGNDVEGNTQQQQLDNQIKAGKELLKWAKRLGETAAGKGLSEENVDRIERRIEDLKYQKQVIND